ncbi:MAG TPA: NADAR domain-containing protein [Actinoallomurus sp.]|nr:NADAR domain-containing protein [Actinoallomurus sp.]
MRPEATADPETTVVQGTSAVRRGLLRRRAECPAVAERYMMAGKARLFGDAEAEAERLVLASDDPGKAKGAGRRVRGFDEDTWLSGRQRRSRTRREPSTRRSAQRPVSRARR